MVALPEEFLTKYTNLLGEERANQLFSSFDEPPVKAFRLNPLKSNFEEISYSLANSVPHIKNAYGGQISGRDVEQLAGYVYSQDPAAMYVAEIADVKPGEKVLDLCAAPGGKTTQLASAMLGEGVLVSNEINSKRAEVLLENVERWGIKNTVVTNEAPDKLSKFFPQFFDKIVVDAPCSGEGMFRKDHDAIQYWSNQYVLDCAKLQKEIVTEAYKMLKPGGQLIYSTCTFSPEEDEQIVEFLLKQYSDLEISPIKVYQEFDPGRPEWGTTANPALTNTARFWTSRNFGEGQFVAKLQKAESEVELNTISETNEPSVEKETKNRVKRSKKDNKRNNRANQRKNNSNKNDNSGLDKSQEKVVAEFLSATNLTNVINETQISNRNEHLFVPALDPEVVTGLRILRNGLALGELKVKRVEPHQHLAEAIAGDSTNTFDLPTQAEFERFSHGETIKVGSSLRGYVFVSYKNKIFSWGKIGNDQILKNFYPKGLRLN